MASMVNRCPSNGDERLKPGELCMRSPGGPAFCCAHRERPLLTHAGFWSWGPGQGAVPSPWGLGTVRRGLFP